MYIFMVTNICVVLKATLFVRARTISGRDDITGCKQSKRFDFNIKLVPVRKG